MSDEPLRNRLLGYLPPAEAKKIRPLLKRREGRVRDRLYEAGKPIDHVYFVDTGVVSMVTYMDNGDIVEVATIGNEGMVGLPVFLGVDESPLETFHQVPGVSWSMPAEAFKRALDGMPRLQEILRRYTQALFVQIARNAACNGIHNIEQRCARWLLMTHDRVGQKDFDLTQEFLSQMLGVRRAGVSQVMSRLQQKGLVTYERGHVRVLDREALEEVACDCYRHIRQEYDRVVGAD
jgi:CRP-like cAMP-binding protein